MNRNQARPRVYPVHEVLPPEPVDPTHPCHCGRIELPYHHVLWDHGDFREWRAKQSRR